MGDDGIRKALGRCLQEFLGPVAEETGQLIADQVRFLRWRALLKIVERAKSYTKKNHLSSHTVPLRFLVPFAEQASLQDEDSELSDMWSKLLANARDGYDDRYVTFLSILNALGGGEAALLKEMWRTADPNDIFSAWTVGAPMRHLENNMVTVPGNQYVLHFAHEVTSEDFVAEGTVAFFFNEDGIPNMNELNFRQIPEFIDLQHLQALGLVSVLWGPVSTPQHRHYVVIGRLSPFGYDFLEACECDEHDELETEE